MGLVWLVLDSKQISSEAKDRLNSEIYCLSVPLSSDPHLPISSSGSSSARPHLLSFPIYLSGESLLSLSFLALTQAPLAIFPF